MFPKFKHTPSCFYINFLLMVFTHTFCEHGRIMPWQLISSQSCCLLSRLSMVLFEVYGKMCRRALFFQSSTWGSCSCTFPGTRVLHQASCSKQLPSSESWAENLMIALMYSGASLCNHNLKRETALFGTDSSNPKASQSYPKLLVGKLRLLASRVPWHGSRLSPDKCLKPTRSAGITSYVNQPRMC